MSLETLKPKVAGLIEIAQNGGGGNTDELEAIIDNSGVLDSTESTIEEKVEQLVEKGEQARLWERAVFKNSALDNQNSPFIGYTEKTIPRIDFSQLTQMRYAFSNSAIEYIDYYINSEKATSLSSIFSTCKKLTRLVGIDVSNITSMFETFSGCSSLESIERPFDASKITGFNKTFNGCGNLKDIRFVAETIKVSIIFTSTVLSAESIQSIIDGLATVETMQTLTLNSTVANNLTAEQLTTIFNKNWTTG